MPETRERYRVITDADAIRDSLEEPSAFVRVFERHHGRLLAYCRRRAGDDGEDIASEVFARAFDLRARYDLTRADAAPWLFGIATNLIASARRAERRQLRAYARLHVEPSHTFSHDVGERIDAARAVAKAADAVRRLPPRERDVLLLVAWAELSQEEVADALAVPIGTVKSRLSRARGRIRRQLGNTRALSEADLEEPWTTST